MNLLYVYPENKVTDEAVNDPKTVREQIISQLGHDEVNRRFIDAVALNIEVAGTMPKTIKTGAMDRCANSGYDLSKVFDKIDGITTQELHGIALDSDWNESNLADFGRYGQRDIDSKLEIINGIVKEYPELDGRFVLFGSILGFPELAQHGKELFAPRIKSGGTTAQLIQFLHDTRTQMHGKIKTGVSKTGLKGKTIGD